MSGSNPNDNDSEEFSVLSAKASGPAPRESPQLCVSGLLMLTRHDAMLHYHGSRSWMSCSIALFQCEFDEATGSLRTGRAPLPAAPRAPVKLLNVRDGIYALVFA
jgi:hypothetical protein